MKNTLIFDVFAWTALNSLGQASWFGNDNKYKCRCSDCPECTGGCHGGWFGPACQYLDLVSKSRASILSLADNDPKTCAPNRTDLSAGFDWRDFRFFFTWMSVYTKDPSAFIHTKIQFKERSSSSSFIVCVDRQQTLFQDSVVHVHCNISTTVSYMVLTGPGTRHICTVHVSGGRNVALKGNVRQSSTDYGGVAKRAVDGNTDGDFDERSCTHTDNQKSPFLQITFNKPVWVKRILLYNRESDSHRLKRFKIHVYSGPSKIAGYTGPDITRSLYDVTDINIGRPASAIKVISSKDILTLCELEIFGDTACETGLWGRDCEYTCDCNGLKCHPSDGMCLSGCSPGFEGKGCKKGCDVGFFGDCLHRCNSSCRDQLCYPHTGSCLSCLEGRYGPECDVCPVGYFGLNCDFLCSQNCYLNLSCDPVQGYCLTGCAPGFDGVRCNKKCHPGFYGLECMHNCSGHCANNTCNHINGGCDSGCEPGYIGELCDQSCPFNYYGKKCKWKCSPYCRGIKNSTVGRQNRTENHLCNMVTGQCLGGCVENYSGFKCKKHAGTVTVFDFMSPTMAIFLVVVIIIVLIITLLSRKHDKFDDEEIESECQSDITGIDIRTASTLS